jgi:hypothetical protein
MKLPLIKAAAIVALVQGVAHGALILLDKPRHGPSELLVVETMQHYVFNFGGTHRSYWDLYFGYALLASITCFLQAALLWLMAPLAGTDPGRLRVLLIALLVSVVLHACLVLRFFFFVPLAADSMVIAFLSVAILGSKSASAKSAR